MEGMSMVPRFLHISSTAGTKNLSPFSPYEFLLMTNMWHLIRRKKLSMYVTVFFIMYIEKLVCSNSDSNQEVIREQQQLGGNYG